MDDAQNSESKTSVKFPAMPVQHLNPFFTCHRRILNSLILSIPYHEGGPGCQLLLKIATDCSKTCKKHYHPLNMCDLKKLTKFTQLTASDVFHWNVHLKNYNLGFHSVQGKRKFGMTHLKCKVCKIKSSTLETSLCKISVQLSCYFFFFK